MDILSKPNSVYISEGKSGYFIFEKNGNVVVTGSGSNRGKIVTSYGPLGPRGKSGAASLGGNEADPGLPVTPKMLTEGKVPAPDGSFLPPAVPLN